MDFLDGQTLLFDKPKGWTSFDVVRKVRNTIRIKKVGHAGTLDPLASGLLIVCTGKHTKTIEQIQGQEKEYIALVKFGATTASYDGEEPEENLQDASHLTEAEVEKAMQGFLGEIWQTPPIFSAVKVDGQRAYKAARAGREIKMRQRQVQLYELELLGRGEEAGTFSIRIRCSKGTYIRSLAHDLGKEVGVGAYLRELQRTRIGAYRVEDAWDVAEFAGEFGRK
jgi:tRNA pseudouridine55 synthase